MFLKGRLLLECLSLSLQAPQAAPAPVSQAPQEVQPLGAEPCLLRTPCFAPHDIVPKHVVKSPALLPNGVRAPSL